MADRQRGVRIGTTPVALGHEVLARDGLTIRTARGTIRAHPATRIRREAEGTFLAALRQLGLEGR